VAEQDDKQTADEPESIDYGKSASDVDKAKQKARDADAKRLAEESQ
jgi:hypothetical protein